MSSAGDNRPSRMETKGAMLLLVAVSIAFGWILLPFYGTIMWGAIIALLFSPLNYRLLHWLGQRRTLAALLTLMLVLVIVILPFALLSASLAREASVVYERVQSGELNPGLYFRAVFATLPDWIGALLDRFNLTDFDALQRRLTALLAQASQFLATQALSVGQNAFEFVASLFITLYLAFFLIRDGDAVVGAVQRAIPLSSAHKEGALGGLAFWFLDVTGSLLWAVLMGFLSLLPAVGAGLVWVPVAVYFLVTGAIWQGVGLTVYGVLVIGLVDNLLRPILVGKDTRMPDYVVMITTIGGMAVFGINGFVLGPVIAAMFFAVWHLYVTDIMAGHRS